MRRLLAAMMAVGCLSGCATSRVSEAPGLDVIVKADPKEIAPDDSGARRIQSTTGCQVDAVRSLAIDAFLFRLRPTPSAPDVQHCLLTLRAMPGVQYAVPDDMVKSK